MNGNQELETSGSIVPPKTQVDLDVEKTEATLSKFEETLGLPKGVREETVQKATELLSTDWFALKDKDLTDLMIDSCILTDYSIVVQRIINRAKSTILYCNQRIRKLVMHQMPNVKAYSFEEREAVCLKNNEFGTSLHYKRTEAELHLSRFEGLNYSIKNLADKIESLVQVKLQLLKK